MTSAEVAGTTVELVQLPAGMPVTPLRQTVADVLAWDRDRGEPPLDVGLSPEDEAKLLLGHE